MHINADVNNFQSNFSKLSKIVNKKNVDRCKIVFSEGTEVKVILKFKNWMSIL